MAIEDADFPPSWASDTSKRLASLALRASNVCPSKTHVAHLLLFPFASHIYELAALLKEMQREAEIRGARLASTSTRKMDAELKSAEQLVDDYYGRCSLYLLMCCPDLLLQLKRCYNNMKAVLDSFSRDEGWSGSLKLRLSEEKQALQQGASIKLGPKEQSLHDSLEPGVLDSIVTDASLTSKLAKQIADCLGFGSLDSEGFGNEISRLKMEKDGAELRRGMAHALYLQQFIILLEKAVAAASIRSASFEARALVVPPTPAMVRDTLVLPLQSFICPITQDVMRDPVQIASGQTYERKAIERWFADGHTRCPTGVELANTNMKSNIALKQSIAEWKDRNNNIRLDVAADLLRSASEEQQMKALRDLQALCEEESLYKYKVASKSLMPLLVHLAESSDLKMRQKAFSMLGVLADNEECQELMVKEKVIELVVRCLARQNDEAAQCVQLMRTLSGNKEIAERISHVPSAVLFLVTLIHDEHCAHNVKDILENLPKSDDNVVIMAEANIIKPLILRLQEGKSASKVLMAKTLGRLHMPDSRKTVAATEETMQTLAKMAESAREEEREAAVMALESLSSVTAARQGLQEAGALGTLLRVLKGVRHSDAAKRGSAAILANVWAADDWTMSDAELEDAVCTYFQLLGPPTPVHVQLPMLQGLLGLARGSSDAARQKMNDCNAFTCLLRLFLSTDEPNCAPLRCPCLDLLACLGAHFRREAALAILDHPAAVHRLADLVKDSRREPELHAATSFVACLPDRDSNITKLLLQEPELVQSLIRLLKNHRNDALVEAAAGALLRFTLPDDVAMQVTLAKAGVIQTFVGLLRSGGAMAREQAAMALCNFSMSSSQLSEPAELMGGGAGCLMGCFSQRRPPMACRVHGGQCSVEGTFCLLEADAVVLLVEALREEGSCVAASLMALGTLVAADKGDSLEEGCAAIEKPGGFSAIIGLMGSAMPQVQELAALLCEKFFSIPRYRIQYGTQAQMHIIMLAQKGTPPLRQLAGRLLRHLELLHSQSNYFGVSVTTS